MIKKLVKKAIDGDKNAFSNLILYFQQDLYKIAISRLPQESDAYDAIQETIIAAYSSISKLSNTTSFKSWLIKILINKCNDIYRKQNKVINISFEENDCENYISTDYIENNSNLEFYNLLNLLNENERTILVLHYLEGYSLCEIAQILDTNSNTIRSRLLRAKKKIEDNLKEENYG